MEKIRRIIALLTVLVIIALVIVTLVCAITGSPYFFAMLFLTFTVPLILWVFMWFIRLLNKEDDT